MSDAAGRPIDAEDLLAHAGWLRALARSLVRDEHAAEDVVQTTFAAALAHPVREPGALRGWLARVARNAAWRSLRTDRRRALREFAAPRAGAAPAADDECARLEMQRALLDAVQALEPAYRTVVMLRFYDGKPPRAIARELGLAPEVVWQRLSRATAMLRARLDARPGGRDAWRGAFLLWVGARDHVPSGVGAAAGTGVAVMGTKTLVALGAAAALALWLVWPRADSGSETAAAPRPEAASHETAPARVPPRARTAAPDDERATAAASAPARRATTRGRVLDDATGEPIEGARVTVHRKSETAGFTWRLVSGADGVFEGEVAESAELRPGTPWSQVKSDVFVECSAQGYIWFYEGPWSGGRGEDLGEVRLRRGTVVRGRVVDAEGRAVADASLYATAGPARYGMEDALNRARPLGRADAAGRFELAEALPQTRRNEVFTLLAVCDAGVGAKSLAVPLGQQAIDDVVIRVGSAGTVVRVLDPEGRPFEGAEVRVHPQFAPYSASYLASDQLPGLAGDERLRGVFVKRTGSDGRATFAGLPMETGLSEYTVVASANGYLPGIDSSAVIGSPTRGEIQVRLRHEQSVVAGARVVDMDGRPVGGAVVTDSLHGVTRTTDADGVFVLAEFVGESDVGYAHVAIAKEGFAKREAQVVQHRAGGTIPEIALERPMPVAGVVVDQSGRPLAGVTVMLCRGGERWVRGVGDSSTGADGAFEFLDATDGEWGVHAMPMGAGLWKVPEMLVVRGGARDVVVRIEAVPEGRATLIVTLTDAETGKPADAEAAVLLAADPDLRLVGRLPQPRVERGRVTVDRVRPGDHVLWVAVPDRPFQMLRVHVAEGETDVRSTLVVRRGVAVSGVVRRPAGFPGGALSVRVSLAGGLVLAGLPGWDRMPNARGIAPVSDDGGFRIEGLTPARYRVSVSSRGWSGEVEVDATNGDATGELVPSRAASLRVRTEGHAGGSTALRFDIAQRDGGWSRALHCDFADGRPVEQTLTLPPGLFRWRAVFRASMHPLDPIHSAEPQSGELTLVAGETTDLVIPVLPRR